MIPRGIIPRGTTPTIRYRFRTVNATDIVVAYMTMKQGALVVEKTLADATAVHDEANNYLEWTLTQAETLSFSMKIDIEIQCRWRTGEGVAGESPITITDPARILKEGEI